DAPETGDEFEIFPSRQLVVEQRLVRQPCDEALGGDRVGACIDIEHVDVAGVRRKKSGNHPQCGCLAGAVGTEQGVELATADIERDAVDGLLVAIALGETGNGEGRGHASRSSTSVSAASTQPF